MTSLNLATIFGPNLLHKQKNSDKEFAVESFARAEESSAVISVVQRMIDSYEMLFMVSPAQVKPESTAPIKGKELMNSSQVLYETIPAF